MTPEEMTRKNVRLGMIVLAVICLMIGATFASVPLYRLFCQITGYDGTPKTDPNAVSSGVLEKTIVIRFNADVIQGMPWQFRPDHKEMTLKIGEKGFTSFYAKNPTNKAIEGTAIFNVLPETAGPYFHKTECFCFGRQTLAPGAEAHMPVAFFVDPKIVDDPDMKDVSSITLSYTFFRADSKALEDALQDLYNSDK